MFVCLFVKTCVLCDMYQYLQYLQQCASVFLFYTINIWIGSIIASKLQNNTAHLQGLVSVDCTPSSVATATGSNPACGIRRGGGIGLRLLLRCNIRWTAPSPSSRAISWNLLHRYSIRSSSHAAHSLPTHTPRMLRWCVAMTWFMVQR